jgi:cysteine desulfurase family protein (TIGR01976 family)
VPYDVARVRSHFPQLKQGPGTGAAHFDGPGGSQTPDVVAQAMYDVLVAPLANRGDVTPAERNAEAAVVAARAAVGDLLAVDPAGVVFGRSMTQLTMDLARALSSTWEPGDEVVVTRLDHDGNIRPWVDVAATVGATVQWAEFDKETAELPLSAVTDLLSDRTRVVAVTGASNLLGTRPDVAAIAAAAHEVGALVYVDGVHLAPHAPVDVAELGADFFACSPYKFFGPHHGVLVADPALWETVQPDKLLPSSNAVPERFELGTLPYEILAGTTAAVDFIADLASAAGDRRTRIVESMQQVEAHEEELFERLLSGLRSLDAVTVYGAPRRRTPTALFSIDSVPSAQVYQSLADLGVNAPASSFYALEASRWMGLGDTGAVRAGIAPYSTAEEVDRLLAGVAKVAR